MRKQGKEWEANRIEMKFSCLTTLSSHPCIKIYNCEVILQFFYIYNYNSILYSWKQYRHDISLYMILNDLPQMVLVINFIYFLW